MEKSYRKCAPKASPRLLFILVNNPKRPLYAKYYFKKIYLGIGLSKTLKKGNFTFSFEPSLF